MKTKSSRTRYRAKLTQTPQAECLALAVFYLSVAEQYDHGNCCETHANYYRELAAAWKRKAREVGVK